MKKNIVLSVLVSSLKYSVLIAIGTGLFSMAPVGLIYYLIDSQNSIILGHTVTLPFDWFCVLSFVIGTAYLFPVLIGGVALTCAVGFYRVKMSKRSRGLLIGGIFGVVVFFIGTECFFNLTGDYELANWIFWTTMMIWGSSIFAWLGYRIEGLYASKNA